MLHLTGLPKRKIGRCYSTLLKCKSNNAFFFWWMNTQDLNSYKTLNFLPLQSSNYNEKRKTGGADWNILLGVSCSAYLQSRNLSSPRPSRREPTGIQIFWRREVWKEHIYLECNRCSGNVLYQTFIRVVYSTGPSIAQIIFPPQANTFVQGLFMWMPVIMTTQ